MKQDIFNFFINDILDFLSQYMNINKIEKNYKSTIYKLTPNKINYIPVKIKNSTNFEGYSKLKVKENTGVTTVPVSKKNKDILLTETICLVRDNAFTEKIQKGIIFHELMHVGSTSQNKVDNKIIVNSGLTKIIYQKRRITKGTRDLCFLNEAMTELVAKFIYDSLYNDKYDIKVKIDDKYMGTIYYRQYFLLAYLLLNYFEDNPEDLFEIYFNNNLNLLEYVLRKTWNITLKELKKGINTLKKSSFSYFENQRNILYRDWIDKINIIKPIKNKNVRYQFNL